MGTEDGNRMVPTLPPLSSPASLLRAESLCAHCAREVSPDQRSPCPECGAMLHARCYVEAGGCPTRGCGNASEAVALRPSSPMALWEARRTRMVRRRTAITLAGGICGGTGALGMALSLLEMGAAGFLVGTFGFVGGALLVTTGLVALTLAAVRPPPSHPSDNRPTDVPAGPGALYVVASVLAGLSLLAGVGGMGMSLVVLSLGFYAATVVGGGGFLAGALLVFGGGVSTALLALAPEDPPSPSP